MFTDFLEQYLTCFNKQHNINICIILLLCNLMLRIKLKTVKTKFFLNFVTNPLVKR